MRLAPAPLRRLVEPRPWLEQLIKFCLVGTAGIGVDTAVLALMTELVHLDPRVAAVPAFAVAVTWTYTVNRFWTFGARGESGLGASYLTFVTVCLAGLLIRLLTMHLLMEYAGLGVGRRYYLASLIGIFAATLSNFLGSKFLAFRPSTKGPPGS